MKIEKINDRQICCIISSEDLISNKIKLSELAFGSNKAKGFFRDIMLKARNDCGFDGLNSPLMIEAMPQPPDSIKLIITKMNENSKEPPEKENQLDLHFEGVDEVLNMIREIREAKTRPRSSRPAVSAPQTLPPDQQRAVIEAFRFPDIDSIVLAAAALKDFYDGENSLYSEPAQNTYLLTVRCVTETPEEFNKICNILTEYSIPVHCSESGEYYMKEHGNEMIADRALQILAGF